VQRARISVSCVVSQVLFAFFGLKQHVVRIADFLFPSLPDFSVPAPIVKLKLVQAFEKFLVEI
jgi:hypothetical protein